MTPDHQSRGRKAIKGATAAAGYESKPLDLPTLVPSCTFPASPVPPVPTSTSVESLSKLPALLTMFMRWMAVQAKGIRYFPSLWQNCSAWPFSFSNFSLFCEENIQSKRLKGEERGQRFIQQNQWGMMVSFLTPNDLCFRSTFQRRSTKCWENATSASQKRPPEDTQNSFYVPNPPEQPGKSQWSFKKICIFPCEVWKGLSWCDFMQEVLRSSGAVWETQNTPQINTIILILILSRKKGNKRGFFHSSAC